MRGLLKTCCALCLPILIGLASAPAQGEDAGPSEYLDLFERIVARANSLDEIEITLSSDGFSRSEPEAEYGTPHLVMYSDDETVRLIATSNSVQSNGGKVGWLVISYSLDKQTDDDSIFDQLVKTAKKRFGRFHNGSTSFGVGRSVKWTTKTFPNVEGLTGIQTVFTPYGWKKSDPSQPFISLRSSRGLMVK